MVSLEEFQHLMLLQVADGKAHVLLPRIERTYSGMQYACGSRRGAVVSEAP